MDKLYRPYGDGTRCRSSVRHDVSRSAATGAPLIGCLSGLRRVAIAGRPFALGFDLERPTLRGGPGIVEVAALADLALGGAIRDATDRSLPLPTISMTIQLDRCSSRRTAAAAATAERASGSVAGADARLLSSDGQIVGRAQGLFAVPNRTRTRSVPPMPWDEWERPLQGSPSGPDFPETSTGSVGDSAPNGEAIVEQVVEHSQRSPTASWVSHLVAQNLRCVREGVAELVPIAASANRGGHVQGGLLFGLAVLSNPSVHDFNPDDFVTGTMEFVGPGSPTESLTVHTEVFRATTRTAFCDVRIQQAKGLIAHASTVFRR